ncbi:MAG: DUF348 domain-containing protein [Clostridiales bacterium]|nr:DUF348 domain-containing protein [Clostridiales bacterium]
MAKSVSRVLRRKVFLIRLYIVLLSLILVLALLALISQAALAKTYVVTDGDRVVTYTTFASEPETVLEQLGLSLNQNDTYTTQAVEGAAAITVRRAQKITVHYHGQTTLVTSFGETAGELLSRLGLDVTGEDVVSHGLEEETYDGMELRVDRPEILRQVYTAAIPHPVSRCSDPTLPVGTEAVLTPGTDGEMRCTAEITYLGGQEAGRQVLLETVTRQPVAEIIAVGTGSAPAVSEKPVIADGRITLPTGEVLTYTRKDTVRATAYTHTDRGCDTVTATGTRVHRGTAAVDPRFIPYGTRMFIVSSDGSYVYGIAAAEDCGGDIKGDRMDLYLPTHAQCTAFGRRVCTVYFLG